MKKSKFAIQDLEFKVDAAGSIEATRVSTKVVTTAIKAVSDIIVAAVGKKS